jgi:hypothetical protein
MEKSSSAWIEGIVEITLQPNGIKSHLKNNLRYRVCIIMVFERFPKVSSITKLEILQQRRTTGAVITV